MVRAAKLHDLLLALPERYEVVPAGGQRAARYCTLYFDTPDLRCFHDHRRGRYARHKVRIRHYPDRGASFLEVKTKGADGVTRKKRLERPYGASALGTEERDFIVAQSSLPADLGPEIWVDFHRVTLLGTETRERVTLDVDVALSRGSTRDLLRGVAILEVKQAPFNVRTPIMRALRRAGVRPASVSKYCTGLALTRPGLRLNRLLPALRAVERMRSE